MLLPQLRLCYKRLLHGNSCIHSSCMCYAAWHGPPKYYMSRRWSKITIATASGIVEGICSLSSCPTQQVEMVVICITLVTIDVSYTQLRVSSRRQPSSCNYLSVTHKHSNMNCTWVCFRQQCAIAPVTRLHTDGNPLMSWLHEEHIMVN